MKRSLQAHARAYAHILAQLFAAQGIAGQLLTAERGARYLALGTRLYDPQQVNKAIKIAEPLALAAKIETVIAARQIGLVTFQFELQKSFWQTFTRAEVSGLAVGLAERRRPIEFSFDDAPHALFAGTSGSCKTEAVKSALVALVQTCPPAALGLVVIDTNSELDDFRNCAHLAAPIAGDGKEAAAALSYAHRELARRKAGNIKDDKRLLVVIDEISDLTADPANVAMLKDIAKQGRKYRLNLMVGNQKPSQKELPAILDNLLNRFVGQTDNAQTSAILTGHSGLAAHRLTGAGDFLHVAGGKADRFQIARATAADFASLERKPAPPMPAAGPVIDLPDPVSPAGGRPKAGVDFAVLGAYFARKVMNRHLSIAGATARFGHKRTIHNRYVEAMNALNGGFYAELNKLRGIAQ